MLSKFLNTKTLVILLILLVGIFLITEFTKKEDRTFRSQLVSFDTAAVTKIEIIPKIGGGYPILLTRETGEWKIETEGRNYKPDVATINNILAELLKMRTERVASTDKSKWAEMEVTDSTASRIKVYGGSKLLSDLYLGKFSYSQAEQANPYQRQQTMMFTNIRLADDETVYVVEGFIKMSIQPNVNTYRAKTLFSVPKDDITRVSFNYPGESFNLTFENGKYWVDGILADSAKVATYLMKFGRLTSNNYIDEVEGVAGALPFIINLEGNNFLPVELRAYPADSVNQYVVTSSLISDAKFSGAKGNLYSRIFISKDALLPHLPE